MRGRHRIEADSSIQENEKMLRRGGEDDNRRT